MRESAVLIIGPHIFPVVILEIWIVLIFLGPGDIVPAVVCWQIQTVGFMIRCYDDASDVKDAVLFCVLLIDAKHVRRRSHIDLSVLIKLITVEITASVARLAYPQNY